MEPSETDTVEGNRETFIACSTTGIPAPSIVSWLKNGEVLQLVGTKSIVSPGSLRLGYVSRADDGYYQCVAQNSFASVISKRAKLNVACKFQIFSTCMTSTSCHFKVPNFFYSASCMASICSTYSFLTLYAMLRCVQIFFDIWE